MMPFIDEGDLHCDERAVQRSASPRVQQKTLRRESQEARPLLLLRVVIVIAFVIAIAIAAIGGGI